MKKIFFLSLLILILGLSSCGTVVYVGDQNNPIDVEYALKNIEQYADKPVYIKCYPVAYKPYTNYTGSKLIKVYFSDLKSDYRGELDLLDSIGNWVDAFVHEDDPLWIEVLPVFFAKAEPQQVILKFSIQHDDVLGYYPSYADNYSIP